MRHKHTDAIKQRQIGGFGWCHREPAIRQYKRAWWTQVRISRVRSGLNFLHSFLVEGNDMGNGEINYDPIYQQVVPAWWARRHQANWVILDLGYRYDNNFHVSNNLGSHCGSHNNGAVAYSIPPEGIMWWWMEIIWASDCEVVVIIFFLVISFSVFLCTMVFF